jgi:hypothetical protein
MWIGTLFPRGVEAQASREIPIKAAYLVNFAKYIDWPDSAFADATSPIIIGILGTDSFGVLLDKLIENKVVKDREFLIKRFPTLDALDYCHILFIGEEKIAMDSSANTQNPIRWDSAEIKNLMEKLEKPMLLVGDFNGFAEMGGHIEFKKSGNNIKFIFNLKTARQAGLDVRSSILRVAAEVKE